MLRWIERLLWTVGAVCLSWGTLLLVQHRAAARAYDREVDLLLASTAADGAAGGAAAAAAREREPAAVVAANEAIDTPAPARLGTLLGRIDVPRLRLSAAIVEGDDEQRLEGAAGHLPDTPMPWQPGNSAIAAHRDTLFRPLQHVRAGDRVQVTTPQGRFEYVVRDTLIVQPRDVWVLDPTPTRTLTLITCYPFSYVGHAPKRFIVRAVAAAAEIQ